MTPRIDVYKYLKSDAAQAMLSLGKAVEASGLEHSLLELVKVRASQINGCAYCLDMHTKDARALGETEQRLYALNAWRETPFFSVRERAARAARLAPEPAPRRSTGSRIPTRTPPPRRRCRGAR